MCLTRQSVSTLNVIFILAVAGCVVEDGAGLGGVSESVLEVR